MTVKEIYGVPFSVDLDTTQGMRPDDDLDAVIPAILEVAGQIAKEGVEISEGSATPVELSYLIKLVKSIGPAPSILEIGMNAGMSTVAMLEAAPDATVVSYDLGEWECATRAAKLIQEKYGIRHEVVWGDSKVTLPRENRQFDFGFVDGGHDTETAYSDILFASKMCHMIMVDDTQFADVLEAVRLAERNGLIVQVDEGRDEGAWVNRRWAVFNCNGNQS